MLLLNVLITLSYAIYNITLYFYYGFDSSAFLMHILLNMLVNIFMVQLVSILIGWALALFFNRLIAYMLATLFLFLGSQIFESIIIDASFIIGRNFYPFFEFFNFSIPSITWSINFHFGFSILPDSFWLMMVWIVMLLSAILIHLSREKRGRITLTIISLIVLAISFRLYQQPLSRYAMNFSSHSSLMYDPFHYEGADIQTEVANFTVLTYDLDITVRNQIYVTATLTIDELLSEYQFTLYHRYVVSSIVNQAGEEMSFVQEGDHFTVYNTVQNLESITIHYVGYSPRFYSNRQGMILPGFFPYFPQPGHQLVFDSYLEAFKPIMLPEEAYFNVTVTGASNVFSNLEEIAPNHFSGYTTSVTLISGFLNSQAIDGTTIVYPFLNHMEFNYENNIRFMNYFIQDFSASDTIQTILILPNLNLHHMSTVVHGDHITTGGLWNLAEASYHSLINPRKFTLYWLIDLYTNDQEAFYYELAWEQSVDIFDHYRFLEMMQNRIGVLGEGRFLELALYYIEDDTDERSIGEFLLDLEEASDVRN